MLALTLLIGFLKRWATTYTITTRRLNIKRGIVSREIQETRLERVQNVNTSQSVYQRLMQIGDVDFDTAASGGDYDFIFYGVADPQDVVHQVDQATGANVGREPRPRRAPGAGLRASRASGRRLRRAAGRSRASRPSPRSVRGRSASG